MNNTEIFEKLNLYGKQMNQCPDHGVHKLFKIQSALCVFDALENIFQNQNEDPYPLINETLQSQITFIKQIIKAGTLFTSSFTSEYFINEAKDELESTKKLFEEAWCLYSDQTYTHSVKLISDRLLINGFNEDFFKDKICFDGGCGTGRFAIAMAALGAKKVIAADIGEKSLEFAKSKIDLYKLKNIELITTDITDLSQFDDSSFDFVVSNGVLHHTIEAERGLSEHFRITRKNGFLWIYLYGKGGIYWHIYDELKKIVKNISFFEAKSILKNLQVREGALYSFLDNVYAPIRKYYYTSEIVAMYKKEGDISYKNLKGITDSDGDGILKTNFGKIITGPEGEVRILIQKK